MHLLPLWLASLLAAVLGEAVAPGSCSQGCQRKNATQTNLLPCSCSSSCALYRDCCADSPHRDADAVAATASRMCLFLSMRGRFLAVSGCPGDWLGSGQFCSESIGHLPPVTSTASGVTYANLYCAVCNGDGEKLTHWNVELRCCSEHEDLDGRRFVYRKGDLWSKVDGRGKCLCSYVPRDAGAAFADSLELRSCDRIQEISRCSSSWRDDAVRQLCHSFSDPVYIGERIYRNTYCGQCNYERPEQAKCIPTVVERKLSEGLDMANIFEYCTSHHLVICLHYLDHLHRGKSYTFSSLLNIREEGCVPSSEKRCCAGFKYDFQAKRCRRMVQGRRGRGRL